MKLRNLAIIPARSGSKGVKDKNIKLLGGKPLIAHTIEAAIKSNIFDEIMVSTDSIEYMDVAVKYGAKVPFLRSDETSTDTASSWDVVREVIHMYSKNGITFDTITLLQPTTPLRTEKDIKEAYKIYISKLANAVVSVCEVDHSPLWSNTLPEDHSMANFIRPEISKLPRQMLSSYYRINGAIYMFQVEYFTKYQDIYSQDCFAYIMKKENSIDIDDEYDFKIAEILSTK